MSEFKEGDKAVVFYFRVGSGIPDEKMFRVDAVTDAGYKLSEPLGEMEYRFDEDDEELWKVTGEETQIGKSASISEPAE